MRATARGRIHVLFDCEYYSDVRNQSALEDLRLSMLSSPEEVFKDEVLVRNLNKLIRRFLTSAGYSSAKTSKRSQHINITIFDIQLYIYYFKLKYKY